MPNETSPIEVHSPKSKSPKKSKPKATKKAPAKPSKSAKDKLAEGAKAIRDAQAAAKKSKRVINDPTEIIKIMDSKDDLKDIMARRVTVAKDGISFSLDKDTTAGEYVRLFDEMKGVGDVWQLRVGRLILEGEKLPCFNGKFAIAMASSGRSLNSCKHYRMVAANIPANLQLLPYTHLREVVKVPELEDKKAIIMDAVKVEKETGKLPTVLEIRTKADKFKPRKKKNVKPAKAKKEEVEKRDITVEENDALNELEEVAARLESLISSASFLLEIKSEHTATLREKLGAPARLLAQLSDV